MTTLTARVHHVPVVPAGRAGLRHSLRSEWAKFWSVRSTWWTLAVTVVAIIGICALATATVGNNPQDQVADPTRRSLIGFFFAQLTVGVLGVLVMSAEYGTGSIRSTLAAIPRRSLVLIAKLIVFGVVVLVVSEILAFAAFFMGQALLPDTVRHAAFSDPGVARAVVGAGLFLTVLGLLALALATLVRHTAGAIAAYAGVVLVLPLVVQALPTSLTDAITRYLPATIGVIMLSTQTADHVFDTPVFSPWVGFAILGAYAAGVMAVAGWLMVRRDA
jgi:ABC-2 type transport system permease protein